MTLEMATKRHTGIDPSEQAPSRGREEGRQRINVKIRPCVGIVRARNPIANEPTKEEGIGSKRKYGTEGNNTRIIPEARLTACWYLGARADACRDVGRACGGKELAKHPQMWGPGSLETQ
ncbi:hypothetical protein N7486_001277 [Penicillium sp. IBT 16267x]|nr:hypothetical protein N7486_001277 [Penicillium sp. IBT 16267x]